jgi:hypothetical protein
MSDMLFCIQCALEAFVAADGGDPAHGGLVELGLYDGSPSEHMRLKHPNGANPADRRQLEIKAAEIMHRKHLIP